jgi:hypothetical protein
MQEVIGSNPIISTSNGISLMPFFLNLAAQWQDVFGIFSGF